jgi:hypothetical protein
MVKNPEVYNCNMVKIELIPDNEHCIETVARRKYTELLQRLLGNATSDTETEEKLETLRLFLEMTDFSKLRSEYEKQLSAGKNVRFTVHLENSIPKSKMRVS